MTTDSIKLIESFEAKVPLPKPLNVGSTVITYRSYTVVRVTTQDGIVGVGYAYSRGLPIKPILDTMISPVAIGATAEDPNAVRKTILATYWHSAEHGTFSAAVSALDIALQDIVGKRKGKSIAALLGATTREIPIYSVIGYHYGEDESGLIEEIEYAQSRGVNSFKMVVGAQTPERDATRLAVTRAKVGEGVHIAVDAFRSFKTLENAVARVNAIKGSTISFVEDPFLESEGALAIALREITGVPVSFGESQASSKMIEQVLHYNQVDVVRLDALIIGGVDEFMTAATAAYEKGVTVATHIHTEVHAQLAAAIPNLYPGGLEYLDPIYNIDLFHLLIENPIEIRNGNAVVSDAPGFGIEWNWPAIYEFSK
ncbi:MAG: mandelate racemase/muconate lactonizing enzyme family protein [Actinomycetota bacterium]